MADRKLHRHSMAPRRALRAGCADESWTDRTRHQQGRLFYAMLAGQGGHGIDQIAARLIELRSKTKENGRSVRENHGGEYPVRERHAGGREAGHDFIRAPHILRLLVLPQSHEPAVPRRTTPARLISPARRDTWPWTRASRCTLRCKAAYVTSTPYSRAAQFKHLAFGKD
jgi:hypothetical protein